jgi:excinuclease UvrABC nuclease subunit
MNNTIEWSGPFSWWNSEKSESVFRYIEKEKRHSGLYLMTFKKDDKYYVLYVGESGRLENRLRDHFSCYLSGRYSTYDINGLLQIQRNLILSWRHNETLYPDYFMKHYEELSPKIYKMMEEMKLFIAFIDGNKATRETIEMLIISELQKNSAPVQEFLENVKKVKKQVIPMEVNMTFPVSISIVGLPDYLIQKR